MEPRVAIGGSDAAAPLAVLERAAATYGTPVYVVCEPQVSEAARQCELAFAPPWLLHYSLKANDLPEVAGILERRGWGASVVSVGEWVQARAAGFTESETVFEGIGKSDAQLDDIVTACAAGRPLRWLVAESVDEVHALARLASHAHLGEAGRPPLDVLLRLNPAVEPDTERSLAVGAEWSKFGMDDSEIREIAREGVFDGKRLVFRGLHVHSGSQLASAAAWGQAGACALEMWAELRERFDRCDTVDFGGGFPLPGPGRPEPQEFRDELEAAWPLPRDVMPARRAIEPGRYLVGAAGWLVARVLHVRERSATQQVVIDAGMTELVRPALYGARHPIVPLAHGEAALGPTSVEGPVCENTDSFGRHELPRLKRGDLVAIGEAGAYAASFTSRYNGRPPPVELVLSSEGVLRKGRRMAIPPHRPPPDT